MKILGSLTNRIFLASAALAVVSIASAVYFVSRTTTREAEAELQRGLIEAGTLVDQQTASLVQSFTVMARLVADLPRLKAGVAESDPPTVRPLALRQVPTEMARIGLEIYSNSPEHFSDVVKTELLEMAAIIRRAGIEPQ